VSEEKERNACVQEKVANMHLVKHANIAENHVIPKDLVNKYLSTHPTINILFLQLKQYICISIYIYLRV